MRNINPRDVTEIVATDIAPGHITLDGVVLSVSSLNDSKGNVQSVVIEHRSTTYAENPKSLVQVYGQITPNMVRGIVEPVAAVSKR